MGAGAEPFDPPKGNRQNQQTQHREPGGPLHVPFPIAVVFKRIFAFEKLKFYEWAEEAVAGLLEEVHTVKC